MKRRGAYGLIAVLAAALIGAGVWGAAWLTGTTEGVRWLMETVSRHTPLAISARQVEGRLIDRLQLGGVRVVLAPVEMEVDRLDFRWAPLRLLAGRIAAKELTLTGVQIRDNTPRDVPPDLAWPRVTGWVGFFDGGIDRLRANGLTYCRLDGPPVDVTTATAAVLWRNTLLSLSEIAVNAPSGRLTGSIVAGLSLPSLRFALGITPAGPVAGMDAFSLQGRFLPGRGPEQLAGGFTVSGSAGSVKRLELAGEAGMTRDAFNLRQLRLERPGRRGTLTGRGTVTLTAGKPLLAFELRAADLDLAPELGVPTDLSGTLTLTGTPSLYRGELKLANQGEGWRTAHLAGAYQGDGTGVKLAPLRGALLAGSVEGNLGIRWHDGISLEGAISGRNLNPVAIDPEWTGVINFDLAGDATWPGQAPPRGKVKGRLLESRLHGQALTGSVQADYAAGGLHVDRLTLQGKGFAIEAAGELDRRLAFDARVADLGRLIPRALGELRADGWVRWHGGRLEGSITGRGANLAAGGLRITAADLSARLGEEKGALPHVAATLRTVVYGGFRADSVTLEADGTGERHTVNAALHSGGTEARAALSGTYSRGSWRGEIVRFSGRDGVGPWSLDAPAQLSFAAGRISLAPLVITGVQAERLEIGGNLTSEPPGGSVRVAWNGLNMARMNPWLTEVRATGATSGSIRLRFPEGEPPAFSGNARAAGTVTAAGYGIAVREGSLSFDGGEQGMRAEVELRLAGGGVLNGAFSSAAPARLVIPETGRITAEWNDIDLAPLHRWLPGDLTLTGRLAGRATGNLLAGKRLDLTGKTSLVGGQIRWQRGKNGLDAAIRTAELSVGWQGALRGPAPEGDAGRLVLAGRAGAAGALTVDGRRISLDQVALSLDGNERGMHAEMGLSLAGGGTVKGRFSSPRPVALTVPDQGEAGLEWAGIDLSLIAPWLPRSVTLEGRFAGRATGALLVGERFAFTGDAALSGGNLRWTRPGGEIKGSLRSASFSWDWRGEALRGGAVLALAEQGEARGGFQLPLPARFPAAIDRKGPLQASLTGHVREQGILTSLFPGLIQESHGELDADLRVSGTWGEPKVEGTLKLARAGAYLPTAGIHVRDVELAMHLEKELIRIDSFRALSGTGHIEGAALVRLKGWEVAGYQGSITGERFRGVYLPEMQILVSPNLTFEGTPDRLSLRGEVRLPELIIISQPARAAVLPSKDVILVEAPKPVAKGSPMALDVQVRVVLGEKVLVKVEGIDAQLDGGIDLAFRRLDNITSKGEIRVVKGRYRAYGVDLEIVRGRLFYAGGPLNQPTLDILALRTVGDVRAGVTAGGILRAPVIKLYSEPAMPDVDVLAYIVFGHPLGSGNSGEQAAMMAQVAGSLLSQGQSSALQEQIKSRLGLSTLEIQSTAETSSLMGYKQIPVAPAGVAPARQSAGVAQTMLTVGKYLTPQLYFSYGRSLFTGGNLFRLRYDIFKRWQIETQTGSESGVDLYYKIDFN
ncbi:MAG: translocation/assembly module TamB domain-containing protein [Syntrophales bacterium]